MDLGGPAGQPPSLSGHVITTEDRTQPVCTQVSLASEDLEVGGSEQLAAPQISERHHFLQDNVEAGEKDPENFEQRDRARTHESETLPTAPDGGYGWVVCLGVFLYHMIYGGLGKCEGLFFLQFQSRFDTSAQLAAWPGSLMWTVNLFMGPVCGAVVSRYSVRTTFMIGTVFSFSGMLLNGLAPNVYFLFLSHTILGGIGRGLMIGVLLLNLYFDKHRSLAISLATSGNGIGALWVVPYTQHLFEEYSFTGAFLMLSGLSLHALLMAMLFRPFSMHLRFTQTTRIQKITEGMSTECEALTVDGNTKLQQVEISQKSNHKDKDTHSDAGHDSVCSEQVAVLYTEIANGTAGSTDKTGQLSIPNQRPLLSALVNQPQKLSEEADVDNSLFKAKSNISATYTTRDNNSAIADKNSTSNRMRKWNQSVNGCCKSSLQICFPVEFQRHDLKKSRRKTFHWDVLTHAPFVTFCLSTFFFMLANKTAFIYLPAIALSKGLSHQEAALVLTLTGGLDTFGRISVGFLLDLKRLRPWRPYCFNVILFLMAGVSLLIPVVSTLASFCLVGSLYGFLAGAFVAQKLVAVVDILGRERMPSALGVQKAFQGFGTLIGPPLSGALRDVIGNYDISFYLGGAAMLASGLVLLISNVLLNLRNQKKIVS